MKPIHEMIALKGRRAMITGATGHLGRVFSATLRQLGADLVLVDRDEKVLEEMAGLMSDQECGEVRAICADLESERERNLLAKRILETCPNLNVLVNNAAFVGTSNLSGWAVPFDQQSIETWRRAIEVNLTAPFHLVKVLAPLMRGSECASIVNIGSIYGNLAPDWSLYEGTSMSNPAAYAASKGGLHQFTRWLSSTLAPQIRVNAIAPGGIFRNQPDNFVKKYNNKVPLKRMASEEDLRGALVFLVGDMSKYVTGQILNVDGGFGIQ